MTRLLPLLGVLLVFVVVVAAPRSASAGGYDVIACNPTVAGGANHSWGAAADGGMTAYTDCPAGQGIVARNVYDGASSGFLQGAYQIFDAPEGNYVESVSFEVGLRRNDCNWGVELVAGNRDLAGTVLFGLPAGQICDSQFQTPDEYTFFGGRYGYGVNAPRVRIEARCAAGSCSRNGVAAIHVRNVDVRVHDDVAPVLSGGRGALWTSGGWLAGTQPVGFNANDGAGIQQAAVAIDGQAVIQQTGNCDFTYAAPCPQQSVDKTIGTAGLGADGPHTLTLSAVDAAGNPASVSRTIYIDNSPPDAPQNMSVDGGDGWRPSNDFTINWTNNPPKVGAPVAGAEWDLCPEPLGTAKCTHGSATGSDVHTLEHLKLPAPGAYTLKLWLRDAAGNQDQRLSAPPVTLRYDDASPTASFLAPDPNDPTLVAVQTDDRGSGVTSGQIQMRRQGSSGNWLTLPTTVQGGQLQAHIDDEHLGDGVFELQATASDAAGNQRTTTTRADGAAETITLPLRLKTKLKSGMVVRHGRRAHLARAAFARYGQLMRVRGTLKSPEGNPLQDVDVQAWTQVKDGVTPPRLIATVKTSRKGAFSFLVRKGPSRSIKIRYAGTAQIRSATENLNLNVRSKTSMRPNHRRRVNGESVRFHGRIKTGRIPKDGKIVEVQVWVRGKWRTFATTRAGQRGMWTYDYRFDGTRGNQTYRFRARVPRETGYPFATGRSGVVRVRVRGV
jgi:Bacterial Ig-like domain